MEVLYLDGGAHGKQRGAPAKASAKEGIFRSGQRMRKRKRQRKPSLSVAGCAPNYKFNTSPSNFATVDVFFSLFPGRKIALLFSSLESPFVILKVPRCLCLWCQLAATLLKIAGAGNRSTH